MIFVAFRSCGAYRMDWWTLKHHPRASKGWTWVDVLDQQWGGYQYVGCSRTICIWHRIDDHYRNIHLRMGRCGGGWILR